MEIRGDLGIEGVKLVSLKPIKDNRGFFSRNYDIDVAKELGFHRNWVQENLSFSKKKGTLRGLHYQKNPHTETKLVRIITGRVFDVFVDIRRESKTFGKWGSHILSSETPEWLYLPKGIAHGMITLEENMIMLYKVDSSFNTEADSAIKWNDPDLNIKWPIEPTVISEKDQKAQSFQDYLIQN